MDTILIAVENLENRNLLALWLRDHYAVVTCDAAEALTSLFDLCIMDSLNLRCRQAELSARRNVFGGEFPPVLLAGSREDLANLWETAQQFVTDIITTPLLEAELKLRVVSLLRSHRLPAPACDLRTPMGDAFPESDQQRGQLKAQLVAAQKMEAVGRLAGGVAHDFNNLLSVILGYTEMVMEELGSNHPHHDSLKEIHQSGLRAKKLTRQLLAFSRKQVLEVNRVDLNLVIHNVRKLLDRVIGEDIKLAVTLTDGPVPVDVDTAQLEQVLMNLAVNARDAMPDGGDLIIKSDIVELDVTYASAKPGVTAGTYAMIQVSDTGTGMDRQTLDRLFEPFFTTKGNEKGTGLGLATSYGIVKQHNGSIWVYSEPLQGTTFKIYLPLSSVQGMKVPVEPDRHRAAAGSATILVVEDDPDVRQLACRILSCKGYRVIAPESAPGAVREARELQKAIDLVVTDVVMPEMKGPEVYARVREHHPKAQVLYMSGYSEEVITRKGVLMGSIRFLQKPFTANSLLSKVAQAIAE